MEIQAVAAILSRHGVTPAAASFKLADVPPGVQTLAPYAFAWGYQDSDARTTAVESSPAEVIRDLIRVFEDSEDELDAWLTGEESHVRSPSSAYVAFSCAQMAADYARSRAAPPS